MDASVNQALLARLRRFRSTGVVLAMTGSLCLLAAGGWSVTSGGPLHAPPLHPRLPALVLVAMFAITQALLVHIQVRREARSISLSEIPLVLGLLYAQPHAVLAARLVGAVIGSGILRRQYTRPQKLIFNGSLAAAEAAVAVVLYQLTVLGLGRSAPLVWVAGLLACAVSTALTAAAVALLIQLLESSVRYRELGRLAAVSAGQAAAVTSIGIAAAAAWHDTRWSALPLAISCGLLFMGYRAYANLNGRHLSLERLYRFTQTVSHSPEVDGVLRSVLQQARELLHAEQARLTFLHQDAGHHGVEVVLGHNETLARGPAFYLLEPWILDAVVGAESPLLLERATKDPRERDWLERCRLKDSIMVPLRGESGPIAVLAVDDRLGDVRTFDPSDLQLLETVANHAAIALRNGQLVDQLRHESLHDPLTGLPNRDYFARQLERCLDRADTKQVAVGILDLDSFKEVNDTLGHQQGDLLLQEIAARMTAAAGDRALIARLGGDEFAVLQRKCTSADAADRFGAQLLRALQAPVILDGIEVSVSASLGIALAPDHGVTPHLLLKRADLAMYDAKQSGRPLRIFDPSLDTNSPGRLALVTHLRQAVEAGEIEIHLQPLVSLETGELLGAEALARWQHATRGFVPPDEFIPLAERSGLIRPLTDLVLSRAIAACAGWQRTSPGVGVSVNISARSLGDETLVEVVDRLLPRHGLPAELLTLEITESSIMADPLSTIGLLHQLQHRGVRISVDDFGTGYSSLSYLRRLPVTEVKIDKSFVQRMNDHGDDRVIVHSIADLAKNLGLSVVAEGVEDEQTWRLLSTAGCHVAQGYLVSRPLPVEQFRRWGAEYRPRHYPIARVI